MGDDNFQWAILYLPSSAAGHEPFIVAPVVPDTYLAAQAVMAAKEPEENRFVTYTESIAHNLSMSYRIYMLAHGNFFRAVFGIVELLNGYFKYCLTRIDKDMAMDTAYALCTAVFPYTTNADMALHALLAASELKAITKSRRHVWDVEPVRFEPEELPEENITK